MKEYKYTIFLNLGADKYQTDNKWEFIEKLISLNKKGCITYTVCINDKEKDLLK